MHTREIEIFDIEIYPNYFLLNTINYNTKEKNSFIIDDNNNDSLNIINWIKEKKIRVGHNIIAFDNLLLCYIQQNYLKFKKYDNITIIKKLKNISDRIIKKERNKAWDKDLLELFKIKNFEYIDTLSITNTVDRISLKQASINLKFWNVQELPYDPDSILNEEQKEIVKKYCFNDCEISCLLYEKKIPDLELRKIVSDVYNIDATNLNDTAIAKKILDKYYSEHTGQNIKDFKDLRSFNKPFLLKEIIPKFEFKTKPFQDLYNWFCKQEITEKTEINVENEDQELKKPPISYTVVLPNLSITYGLGGIHSNDKPDKFIKSDKHKILDYDFSSYYPNIIINNNIKPRHVDSCFLNILKQLTKERINYKKQGKKKNADILKIVINSIYGLLGSDFYWLKDKKALIKTTIIGQLWLSKFCEELLLENIEVISLNTDGILSLVPPEKEEIFHKIAKNISKLIDIEVELTEYSQYIRRDVNNYLSVTIDNKIKQKGKYFSTEIPLNKGYYYPIIAKALNNWYINGITVEDTILKEKDIYSFIASQKIDLKKFSPELHSYNENFQLQSIKLQKFNRWIVVNKGGKFLKVETDNAKKERLSKKCKHTKKELQNKIIGIEINNFIEIVNKIDINKKYDLNYDFYIKLANETIELITPKMSQMSLF